MHQFVLLIPPPGEESLLDVSEGAVRVGFEGGDQSGEDILDSGVLDTVVEGVGLGFGG